MNNQEEMSEKIQEILLEHGYLIRRPNGTSAGRIRVVADCLDDDAEAAMSAEYGPAQPGGYMSETLQWVLDGDDALAAAGYDPDEVDPSW